MIKICFVCTGNTCRSIMAERLLKKLIKDLKLKDIKVFSKGLNAKKENISENAKLALKHFQALTTDRKSIKLGKIDSAMVYVAMTEKHKEMIKSSKVISFKELIGFDIIDPYGQDVDTYLDCCAQINEGVKALLEKIIKWRK